MDRDTAKTMVGPGWASFIDAIYDRLPESARVKQVKEKFGGLRFYVDDVDESIHDFIDNLELKSFEICETCGKPGRLRKKGWRKTLCNDHA